MLWTYADAVQHVLDFVGASTSARERRFARRAITEALRDVANYRHWSVFQTVGRIVTNAAYSTGTVAYDHTGGAYERMLTLTSGTWPTWSKYGEVIIDDTPYVVDDYKSSSIITLSINSNPGSDVASGETYSLVRDTYPLPVDAVAMDLIYSVTNNYQLIYEPHAAWLNERRYWRGTGQPEAFTIAGDPNYINQIAIRLNRPSASALTLDFPYVRRPRPLVVQEYTTGTVTTTSDSTTVTGSGTVWTSQHVGTIFRPGNDSTNGPTGEEGEYPAVWERRVVSVESATSLTLDDGAGSSLAGVKYSLSDPVDIEVGVMLNLFKAWCEKNASSASDLGRKRDADTKWREALRIAMGADSRFIGEGSSAMSHGSSYPILLRDLRADL